MTDSTLNRFVASGTAAERAAFVPDPPTPASGPDPTYFWLETDTGDSYGWDFSGAAWVQINTAGGVPDPIVPADGTQNITGALAVSGAITGSNLSGTNTGDQTSIVGITGTIAQFNTACTDADFATGGGTATGTNTGDQTITLTGNVTGSGTGSFATTIASGVVTLAMQANMATASVVYRKTAGSGAPEVQTLATLKTDLGLTGTNSGDQTITLTSDVTGSGTGSFATTIAAGVVTLAKMANIATDRLIGRDTAGTGVPEALTVGGGVEFTGSGGIQTSALTGDVTKTAGGTATTIANNAVSFAKFVAAPSVGVVWATGAANYSHNASGGGTANFLRADGTWAVPPGGGGYTPPTGTGFPHITAGSQDAAAKLVDTADINDDQVTLAKIANAAANSKLVGSGAAGAGANYVEITLGTNLSMSGTTLNASGGGSVAWGAITGTLSDQTDLQTALDNKLDDSQLGAASGVASLTAGSVLTTSQFPALTGDVTTAGGALATTIAAGAVTLAKMANIATDRLIGRDTAATGVPEVLTVSGGIEFTGSGGIQTSAFTGDVTKTAGGTATTIASNAVTTAKILDDNVTLAKIANAAANSKLLGSGDAGSGSNYVEITLGTNLSMSGTTLNASGGGGSTPTGTGFRHVTAGVEDAAAKLVETADITDANVTYAKIANGTGLSVVGRAANSAGVNADIVATATGQVLRYSGSSIGFGALDLSDGDAVVNGLPLANIASISASSVLGRVSSSGTPSIIASTADGEVLRRSGSNVGWGTIATAGIADGAVTGAKLSANGQVRSITFIIDGNGSVISTGIHGDLEIPFACTITGWTMLADVSGSIVVDIWKDTYANYPPVVGDSITASDKPTISATTKGQDLAPTGWTTAIAAGDTLRFNVDSASTITRVVLSIRVNVT